ncbi:S-phase kinase-associated protein 2-like isoform X3 [Gordionus sp. m RMFG-2023]|uniref:S-phase kinase-associated protein 2-like isoform X3 n=1 Tax=Gordionus sp. m RMFG-2023 TaxID=3053472 RepID=UPI0031FC285B
MMSLKCLSDDIKQELTLSPPWQKEDFILHTKFKLKSLNNEEKENNWNKLSDEIIIAIFNWLPKTFLCKISLVCHRFYILSHDESLWQSIDLSNKKLSISTIIHLIHVGLKIIKLSHTEITEKIDYLPLLNQEIFVNTNKINKITHLDLSFSSISSKILNNILENQISITHLSLEDLKLDEEITNLYTKYNLQILNLSRCQNLSFNIIQRILLASDRIVELNLAWTNLNTEDLQNICRYLPKSLIKLNLSGNRETLNDEDIKVITENCINIQELDLSDCNQLSDSSIVYITKNLQNLKILALSRCYKIDPNIFFPLISRHAMSPPIIGRLPQFIVYTQTSLPQNYRNWKYPAKIYRNFLISPAIFLKVF